MLVQGPGLIQEQQFRMNPQLLQSLKVMEMPLMELRERIEEEFDRNPALEILKDKSVISLDEAIKPRKEAEDYFEASSDSGFVSRAGEAAAEKQRSFIEGALSRPETLQEHLLWQLRLQPLDDELRRLGELLIQNLDDNGFNKEPLDSLLKNQSKSKIQKAVKVIQALVPKGTCTSGYRESLKVQAALLPNAVPGMVQAVDYLELLERGKIAEAAKKLGVTKKEMQDIFDRIKELSPFPGHLFSSLASSEVRYVIPDVQVTFRDGELVIILNDSEIPVLGINPFYKKLSLANQKDKGKNGEQPAKDFAREKIKEARWFIDAIKLRNQTLLRTTRAIVEFQKAFFLSGPGHLAPLTLADIAAEIGVHEATVSRTAHGKYMQTDRGIFELRYFFTNSISGQGSGGSQYSKGGVKEIIRELLREEGRHLPDHAIAGLLSAKGINISRRTVAKYRKELDLGSSSKRY